MSNAVSICSNALLMLGDDPIASFTEDTKSARRCANIYPEVKRSVLRSHSWNCAIKRVVLSPISATPVFDWQYQFAKPSDWLKTLQVGLKGEGEDYATEGGRFLANTNVLRLRYIAEVDEGLFDSMLVTAMELAMAYKLAYAVTASASMRDSLGAEYEMHMKRARAVDGQDDPSEEFGEEDILIGSRY